MNILLSKKQFIFTNIICHTAATLNFSVFISQICTRELLNLFFPSCCGLNIFSFTWNHMKYGITWLFWNPISRYVGFQSNHFVVHSYVSGKTIWFWWSLGKIRSRFFFSIKCVEEKYTSLLSNWNQFKALAHTVEKSMEVQSWKAKLASTSITKLVSTKKNKERISDNQLGW